MLYYENLFCIFQVVKILRFYDYNQFSSCNFFCEEGFSKKKQRKFKQGTSILSYYIFKSILLFNIDEFIELCYKYNNSECPWIFKMGDERFYNFILYSIKNTNYIKIIDDLIEKYDNLNIPNNIKDSLRMTLYSFD